MSVLSVCPADSKSNDGGKTATPYVQQTFLYISLSSLYDRDVKFSHASRRMAIVLGTFTYGRATNMGL